MKPPEERSTWPAVILWVIATLIFLGLVILLMIDDVSRKTAKWQDRETYQQAEPRAK